MVELIVILAVFGVLMLAGTDFFIQVIHNSNRAAMENEVRQNASKIMQDITNEARKPGATAASLNSIYTVSGGVLSKNGLSLSSTAVAVNLSITGSPIVITLTVQQAAGYTRPDFQATVTLTNTVTPRVY